MYPWYKKEDKEPAGFYWNIELSEDAFQTLEKLLQGERVPARAKERLKTCLMYARRMELPLVGLPWGKLKERATKRHTSDADTIWDWERM